MAKKSKAAREFVQLECSECGRRNYNTSKKTKGQTERLTLKKYCKWCRRHTAHKERKR